MEEIPEAMAEAFTRLRRGRPRPYVLEVPLDVLSDEAEIGTVAAELPPVATPGQAEVEAAAEAIRKAARPLLLAGGGAQGAAAEVVPAAVSAGVRVVFSAAAPAVGRGTWSISNRAEKTSSRT